MEKEKLKTLKEKIQNLKVIRRGFKLICRIETPEIFILRLFFISYQIIFVIGLIVIIRWLL